MIEQFVMNIENIKVEDLKDVKNILSNEKIKKIERFHFEKDQIRGIIGEAMVRYLLVEKYGIHNSDILFGYEKRGKPYLLTPNYRVFFNISHSGPWVVCGMGNSNIGIDVEQIKEQEIKFAKHVLTTKEYRDWLKLCTAEQKKQFYRLWTLKESYSKYLGVGLALRFMDVSAEFQNDGYYSINENEDCVLFSQQLGTDSYLSICVDHSKKKAIVKEITMLDINDILETLCLK